MTRITASMTALLVWTLASPANAVPTAEELLHAIGFSADAKQQVLDGKFVSTSLEPTSERELAMALAFFVSEPPAELIEEAKKNLVAATDPDTISHGAISGSGKPEDFAAVSFGSDAKKQAKTFLAAGPGEDLNLSTAEIGAFRALAKQGADEQAVEDQLRKLLLARFQTYRASGLDGIAAYARSDDKQIDAGADIRRAVEAAGHLKANAPNFYAALLNYPRSRPAELEEDFGWTHYMAHGTPVFLLSHRIWMPEGDAWVMASRQFYVTASYNAVQIVAGFLPVKNGTLVVYVNRTSTDQVTGFGGSGKRAMGTKVMTSQIESLFEKVKAAAEK
ncbi:MAG: hypothetical protein JRF15_11870 [Deltaproteobacteria bacterium]|nr:hypothetical protein [Deltaproteobacteria bacterium]